MGGDSRPHFWQTIKNHFATILRVFLGFKFLPIKEEKNNFPPEEGGILEEFLPLDFTSSNSIVDKLKAFKTLQTSCDGYQVLHNAKFLFEIFAKKIQI